MFDIFLTSPAMMWLAVGALAPVVIHFAARNRPKRTPFPALQFIVASHRRTATKFKLKQLLLLLLRIAALALFAFVIARPWFEGEAAEGRRAETTVTAVIVLDTSFSMRYKSEKTTSFQKAKDAAIAAIDSFTEGESRVCLLFAGPTPEGVITDFKHAIDLEATKKRIRDAEPSFRAGDCAAAITEAVRLLDETTGPGKAVFVFTDMTAESWPKAVPAGEKTGNITVYIVDVGPAEPVNPALLSVSAPSGSSAGAEFEIRARADAAGVADSYVELIIDGDRRGRKHASANNVAEVSLVSSTMKRSNEHWGCVSLTGEDALSLGTLPLDNHRYFTLRSSPPLNVLLVNGAPSRSPREDELHYLRTALAPGGLDTGHILKVSEVGAADLGTADLAVTDVIALCNVASLPAGVWAKIRRFVSIGGGLIVFPGDNVTAAAYETISSGDGSVLPCTFGIARRVEGGTHLEPGELAHPILQIWRNTDRNGDLAEARFKTYLRLTPKKNAEVVLRFKNGDAALVAGKYGTGSVIVHASACDLDWNTLARGVPYVVLMHESVKYLASSRREVRDVAVGMAPMLRIADPKTARSVSLRQMRIDALAGVGEIEAASQKPVDVTKLLNRRNGQLLPPAVDAPGVYRVSVERTGGRKTDTYLFAVNLDGGESNMQRLDMNEDAIRSLVPEREVKIASTQEELLEHISQARSQSELASHLAGIVLAILLGEMYLSNHMRARSAKSEAAA